MTSMPASRSARAMIFAPRSWPSRPGLATTPILRSEAMRRMIRGILGGLLGCSLVALLMAGSGVGAAPVETTIQDDALLLHRSDAQVGEATRTMASLGADRVRITAGWSVLAPEPLSPRRPAFDAEDSAAYPQEGFARLDRAVREARAAGLAVQLDLAFWAPRWAV